MSDRTHAQAGAVRNKPRAAVRYTPNVTPLIDVMFLLLLFFLLTTTFREPREAIPSMLPNSGGVGKASPGPIPALNIYVRPDGQDSVAATYRIGDAGQEFADAQQVYDRLRDPRYDDQLRSQMPVVVRARSDVRWQFVLEAYNQVKRASFSKVTIHKES